MGTSDFEKDIHDMFDHIWSCKLDHELFDDTVGDLMSAVFAVARKYIKEG